MFAGIARWWHPTQVAPWSRRKLLAAAGCSLMLAAALVAGLGVAIAGALGHSGPARAGSAAVPRPTDAAPTGGGPAGDGAGVDRQGDALAAAPMLAVDDAAAQPGTVSTRNPGTLTLPPATTAGPAGVPTGFPHTPAGALAQLAALDQTALQSASMSGVRAVIAAWAAPGGPTPQTWSGAAAMASFLSAAGLSGGGSAQLSLRATPLMGLVKGTVGSDLAVVCVDFEVDATIERTARVGDADCQKMVWRLGRWVIGPGPEAAPGPSVWPDTDTAIDAGYRDLRRG